MRYLAFLLIVCIGLSCQSETNEQKSNKLSYSVDTVKIDSKGQQLDLRRGIWISDLDNQKNVMYLYNGFDHSIDEINLEQEEVTNNFSFKVEGPNGTGDHVNYLNLSENGRFFIKSFSRSALFDRDGNLLKKIDWVNSFDSSGSKYGESPRIEILTRYENYRSFGLSYKNKNREVFLDILSVKDSSVQSFDIDPEKSYHNFVLVNEDPQNYTFLDPYVYLSSENDLVIVSHQYSSEFLLFDSEGDFIKTVLYDPKMTPKRVKKINNPSQEQLRKEYQQLLEQIRFGPLVWDANKKRYLRLSAVRIFNDRMKEDAFLPKIKDVKVYLSIFDTKFKLISEYYLPELDTEFVKYFAKDGKLWVYQNFSDELGFKVIDI